MSTPESAPESTSGADSGFTLVEVIWALFLLGIVAMGSLGLFINGAKTASHLQRNQAAVGVANGAMDVVRSVSGGAVNATGTSGIIKGRSQAAVNASWAAATALEPSDTADMTKAWDPEGGMTVDDQWVPITSTATVDNQLFTVDTLIGECFRLRAAATTDQNCVATNPGGDDYVKLYRARVIVTWDEGGASTGEHSYRLSSLIDPSEDATWNTAVKPFAYDDETEVAAGAAPTFIGVVLNDSVDYNAFGGVSPVITLTQPEDGSGTQMGSVAVVASAGINGVVFTPPADTSKSGTVLFTYKVQGSSGEISAVPATVLVHILPVAVPDEITVAPGSTTSLNAQMLANDLGVTNITPGRETTIHPVWDRNATDPFTDASNLATHGIDMVSGDLMFTAPPTDGVETIFYYYLADSDLAAGGTRYSNEEPRQIKVTTGSAPVAVEDRELSLEATVDDEWNSVDWQDLTDNDVGTTITIVSVVGPGGGDYDSYVRLDGTGNDAGALGTGSVLDFLTAAGEVGTYKIEYSVVSAGGTDSGTTAVITVEVTPLATVPSAPVASGAAISMGKNQRVVLGQGGLGPATTGLNVTNLSGVATESGSCKALKDHQVESKNTIVINTHKNKEDSGVCSFTYRLSTTDSPPVKSDVATVTVEVNP